jgi:copper chaperone CopZ
VSLEAGEARVRFDAGAVSIAQLREAVENAGFDCPA